MKTDIHIDADIAAFVEAQPRDLPYSQVARLVRDRFGEPRAVDGARLREWWCNRHPAIARSKIARDVEVRAFILDLAGRLSGAEIVAALTIKFAASRLPSRSGLYRFLADVRSEKRQSRE